MGKLVRWILEASYGVKTVRGIEWKEAPESSIHGRLLADDGWLVWVVLEQITGVLDEGTGFGAAVSPEKFTADGVVEFVLGEMVLD